MRSILRLTVLCSTAAVILFASGDSSGRLPVSVVQGDSTMIDNWYAQKWQTVDSLLERSLPESALSVVREIATRAARDGRRPQVIRATLYRAVLSAVKQEEGDVLLIRDLEREISPAAQPDKAILQSMLATVYWRYYLRNRWRIASRTRVDDDGSTAPVAGAVDDTDFRTWDAARFHRTVRGLFLESIAPERALQSTSVRTYGEILVRYSGSDAYRPTMYDILAHRAIEFLATEERDIPASRRAFALEDLSGFLPDDAFTAHTYTVPDESDRTATALGVYQALTRMHRNDADAAARVDLLLDRLAFVHRVCVHEDKDTTYLQTLDGLLRTYAAEPHVTMIAARLAGRLADAQEYPRAMQVIRTWVDRFPASRGADACRAIESRILTRQLTLAHERTVLPSSQFALSIGYRNLDSVHVRIVRTPMEDAEEEEWYGYGRYGRTQEDILRDLLAQPVAAAWSVRLPEERDFGAHRVDIAARDLPLGSYTVIVSAEASFALEGNAMHWSRLNVTRLSLQTQQRVDGSVVARVHDAESGDPLPGVRVALFARNWESRSSRYTRTRVRDLTTDRTGAVVVPPDAGGRGIYATLHRGDDHLAVPTPIYAERRQRADIETRILLFTDRALYRPGQTIHFKGIVFRADDDSIEYAAAPAIQTTITLLDANWQKVAEQQVTTNARGSFHGTFTAPAGVLTGTMTLRTPWGQTGIRVEEYRRPTFDVRFDPLKDAVALGDTVRLRGTATSYAGAAIDGATVQYRVLRRARFPYWWWWWRPMPGRGAQEIASGSTTTAPDGSFTVAFQARPDRSVPARDLPVFTYEVTADVTDIMGETRSATGTASAGYTSVMLDLTVPPVLDGAAAPSVVVRSSTLNGQPVPARGTLLVEKLRAPSRILRPRLLPDADRWPLERERWAAAFPHDAWKDEVQDSDWPVERVAMRADAVTDTTGVDTLALGTLAPGRYRLQYTVRDASGRDVTQTRLVTVYAAGDSRPPLPAPVFHVPLSVRCEPGDTASFLWGTSYADVRVLYQLEVRGRLVQEQWLEFDNEQRRFTIPVTERMRGGAVARLAFVRAGRLHQTDVRIDVPWTNKELQISTATFRDKLLPGAREEWRVTIRGPRGEQVAAEMLAAMYDASLDAIVPHGWPSFGWPSWFHTRPVSAALFTLASEAQWERGFNRFLSGGTQAYDRLNLFLLDAYRYGGVFDQRNAEDRLDMMMAPAAALMSAEADGEGRAMRKSARQHAPEEMKEKSDAEATAAPPPADGGGDAVVPRRNLAETAFFFPELLTDDSGSIVLRFTMPEALTRWRLLTFAHTPDLRTGTLERSVVTQKDLMVTPNAPRFFREGDSLVFTAKITSLATATLGGTARLQLFDALTMQPVDARFALTDAARPFTVDAGRSVAVRWALRVPEGLSAVVTRVTAETPSASDGEESALPVLPNRMLVTESLPISLRGGQTRTYRFEKLLGSSSSSTLRHHALTLEVTSNPAWLAVQALPYLMEFPHECSEQVFNRYYANSIAAHLVNADPAIRRVFDRWKGTDALRSNLEKNQQLKAVLLQETPWVLQAQDESERKRRVALLFDLNAMADNLGRALRTLEKAQGANGGWPWFPGMPESRYITQYIVAGLAHLRELGVSAADPRVDAMLERAIRWCDAEMGRDYERLRREHGPLDPKSHWLSSIEIQYLYARSFFLRAHPIERAFTDGHAFWSAQADRHWPKHGLMEQGMLALAKHRAGGSTTPREILASLRERALRSEELGMYWKQNSGWWWWQSPIETQAILIEAFDEVGRDREAVEEMKIWLLKQKQVQDWKTTVATAEACYALLRRGTNLLASQGLVEVLLGGTRIEPAVDGGAAPEAGTGAWTRTWTGGEVESRMGEVTAKNPNTGIAWGALYWQYYEQLDRITPAKTPLSLARTLYRKRVTDAGPTLERVDTAHPLRVGDVLTIRIELRADRDMEYVHLRDMRGAGFEPINQLSRYRWRAGLGYYEAPKDASVNFFLHWLPKGVHIFEYDVRVTHQGVFSNGISSIQCMYAPEFSSHSAGVTVRVD